MTITIMHKHAEFGFIALFVCLLQFGRIRLVVEVHSYHSSLGVLSVAQSR